MNIEANLIVGLFSLILFGLSMVDSSLAVDAGR